jgi:hypothetical protein
MRNLMAPEGIFEYVMIFITTNKHAPIDWRFQGPDEQL